MICSHCKIEGEQGFVIINKRRLIDGSFKKYYNCNPCNTARLKRYRATEKGKESTKQAVKKYEAKNKQRRNAWAVAKIHNKTIGPCEVCSTLKNIHRHHPDIGLPADIVFLCSYHHRQIHKFDV